jgi:TetR/AcrR family transcriptional repressor of nem operon
MARPKAFDVDDALERAMELFWRQGYQATSLPDLVQHMGIGRQSLYDTFGGKRQLFLQALDRYAAVMIGGALGRLERPGASIDDLTAFLEAVVAYQTGKQVRTACLMINSAMELAVSDREVTRRASAHHQRMEDAFRRVLEHAAAQDDIHPLLPVDTVARHMVATILGMVVAAKSGAEPAVLRDMASGALTLAGAPKDSLARTQH